MVIKILTNGREAESESGPFESEKNGTESECEWGRKCSMEPKSRIINMPSRECNTKCVGVSLSLSLFRSLPLSHTHTHTHRQTHTHTDTHVDKHTD